MIPWALVWSGACLAVGYLFSGELELVLGYASRLRTNLFLVIASRFLTLVSQAFARDTNEVVTSDNPATASLWHPLRSPTFRNLLIANVVSDVGTFMQNVGAAWLMVSLNAGPMYVALTQTASALPFFVLALPAGAIGDIVDRRKLILYAELWMVIVAAILAAVTIGRLTSPPLLLILTFALASGDAFESPSWRAILPELVGKDDLAAASALNGIEFNFARAVGPALAGAVVALAGAGTAFVINTLSFSGVIAVVAHWRRAPVKRSTPPETVAGATRAAIRYVRYSPEIRKTRYPSSASANAGNVKPPAVHSLNAHLANVR